MIPLEPFQYVPATITGRPANAFVAVKYENNTGHKMLWKRTRFDGLTTSWYPDRTLYTGAGLRRTSSVGNVDYDQILMIGLATQPQALKSIGYRYAMASPHHISASTSTRRNDHAKFFSDSGGFQLLSGATDFIDPEELAEYYNATIDYGIGLDIPVFGHNDMLLRMIEVMLKNNKLLRKLLVPDVTLYEVSHGATPKTRKVFLDRLLKEKELSPALAIGGIAQNLRDGGMATTVVTGAINLMYVLTQTKGRFERYHVLGTTSTVFQCMYWLAQEYRVAPHITADSASYILPAANNLTLRTDWTDGRLVTEPIAKASSPLVLRCPCPVCSMVKYPRFYVENAGVNCVHNLYVIKDNYDLNRHAVRQYLDGHITLAALAKYVTGDVGPMVSVVIAVYKFVVDVAKTNFKDAYEKHISTLSSLSRGTTTKAALFDSPAVLNESQKKTKARLDTVLTKYEEYHKKRKK